ncbi:MAG: hypothetical protein ABI423_11755 [Burkholderiales bacterium]
MSTLAELRRRIDALSQEIRNYPTPIARCDEQLTQLLEERARLLAQLEAQESKHGGTHAA